MSSADIAAAERLRLALELADLAESMLRSKLRRTAPGITDAEVERRIAAWYLRRPGGPHGDADGEPGTWPRR